MAEEKLTPTGEVVHDRVFGINITKRLHILNKRWYLLSFSILIVLLGIGLFFFNGGLKLGIDFMGGTRLDVKLENTDASEASIRQLFPEESGDIKINTVGEQSEKHFLITIMGDPTKTTDEEKKIVNTLVTKYTTNNVALLGKEFIGPKMGATFAEQAIKLIAIVALMIAVYVAVRFDFFYGIGAIASLIHDLLIMLVFCMIFGVRIDMTVIAAFMTILGYSINDTVVVFDRIRENFKINPEEDYEYIMDKSIVQTFSRTLITSLTVLLVSVALYIWGGRVLNDFAYMMIIGVVSGTYSSIFIASPITFMMKKYMDKKVKIGDRSDKKLAKAKA